MFENLKVPSNLIPSDTRFGVGPSLIPASHVKKLYETGDKLLGTSHRKMAVRDVVKELQDGLRSYLNIPADYDVVLGNGGATAVWDMIGLGLVEKESHHFVCGEFSEKWVKSHKLIPWIKASETRVNFGEGINPTEKEGADFIACTLNETSTGVQMTHLPKMTNPNTIVGVDATSGAGQLPFDLQLSDIFYFSPQKVFASEGGFYVAIMSPKAVKRAEKIAADKTRYIPEFFKWTNAIENSRQNQTYNTPAIATIFFLNEQVKLMNKLGFAEVQRQSYEKAKMVYDWAESKSYLSPYIKEVSFRSPAVATIDVDSKYPVEELTKVLRAQNIAVDIDGYRKLGRNQFRIGMFHNISFENLEKLTKIISLAIESAG